MTSRLRKLMEGRNGIDQLGAATFAAAALDIVGALFRRQTGLSLVLIAVGIYRVMSRDLISRHRENFRFVFFWDKMKQMFSRSFGGMFTGIRAKLESMREYRFFTCPGCKSRLRVKRGRGRIQITCPRCGLRFIKR